LNERIREQRRTQLEASFCGDYRGDNAQIFLQALGVYDKIYDSSLYYGRSIPILQSSGTGKSRLVAEVLKNVRRNQQISPAGLC
ncbi:uncharacterized protein EI90DRAFT_3076347, partial [Cantharellus anzutake]|uniref:uncharacterized protein n=1 Tax=Cantharellus anzutake TaxID=1750568 RepID=UPI0019089C97